MGSKVTEVSEKVATDTADDLKQAAGTFEGDIPGIVAMTYSTNPHLVHRYRIIINFHLAYISGNVLPSKSFSSSLPPLRSGLAA